MSLPGCDGWYALALSGALSALACGTPFDGREVSLGMATDARRDLGACTARECGNIARDSAMLDESNFESCEIVDQGALHLAWEHRLFDGEGVLANAFNCPFGRTCTIQQPMMIAASDRTLWLLGLVFPTDEAFNQLPGGGLVLVHHAWDGNLLHADSLDFEQVVPGEAVQYEAVLAAGRDGHVFVAVSKDLLKEGWSDPQLSRFIEEFGADGARIGDRLVLDRSRVAAREPQLTSAGDGSVALALGDRLALMKADLGLRWVQEQPDDVISITSDERQQVSTYSLAGPLQDREEVRHYDALGRLVWQRGFSTHADARLGTDSRGDIVRIGAITSPEPVGPALSTEMLVHIVSTHGESVSGVRLAVPGWANVGGQSRAAIDVTNTAWFPGATSSEDGSSSQRLYAVDLSRMRCAQYTVGDGAVWIETIAPIPGGGLYVLSGDGYGRIDR